MIKPGRKTLKRLLAAFVLISIIALGGIFVANRWIQSSTPQEILEKIPEGATMAIGRIRQTATRDGIAEWTLVAESGRYDASSQAVELTELSVTYFLEEDGDVELKARSGVLKTDTNSMKAAGNVSVTHAGYTLKTESLDYDHPSRLLTTEAGVHIKGDGMELRARRMTVDLNTETARFGGGVKGILNGSLID